MNNDPVMCYLIGGPFDLTKRSVVHPPKEMVFFVPAEKLSIGFLDSNSFSVKCLPVRYKRVFKEVNGAVIYVNEGALGWQENIK